LALSLTALFSSACVGPAACAAPLAIDRAATYPNAKASALMCLSSAATFAMSHSICSSFVPSQYVYSGLSGSHRPEVFSRLRVTNPTREDRQEAAALFLFGNSTIESSSSSGNASSDQYL
jgi:hypothetical protein